jgi:type I restriction enzyme M protein
VTSQDRKPVPRRAACSGYYSPDNGISVEKQKSEIAKVKTLLSKASKNAKGNAGFPEFIVSNRKEQTS